MASFDIKSEIDHHEITNAVDQANRILQNRFDFKGTGAEFSLNDNQITLSAVEEFQIHQMLPILHESLAKRGVDLKSLKPDEIELATGSATQNMNLQEGIDKELAKVIEAIVDEPTDTASDISVIPVICSIVDGTETSVSVPIITLLGVKCVVLVCGPDNSLNASGIK